MKSRGFLIVIALLLAGAATAAVFQYVRGVEDEAETGGGMVQVIVSKQDIPSGADLNPLLSQGAFTTQAFPEETVVEGAVTSLAQLQGQQTASPILAGEQISMARLRGEEEFGGGVLGIPEGLQAVTISLEGPRAAGGYLRRGDHVTVYATFTAPDERTIVLVPDVMVLQPPPAAAAGGAAAGGPVTLALAPVDAQRLVFAQERGTVWLSLLPPGQEGEGHGPVTERQVSR
jgi:pilus assembly protein CpaB